MATLAQNMLGLIELAKRFNDGAAMAIAEILDQTLEMQDAVYLPSNGMAGHKITRRVSLPSGSFRRLNDGVAPETSRTVQVVETIGLLESYSKVDEAIVNNSPNKAATREQEDRAFVEGLGQTFAETFVYGNTATTPEGFLGLAPRFNTLRDEDNVLRNNVWNGLASGGTSIYIVQWGPGRVYFAYPPNSTVGLRAEDMGVQLMPGETSNTLMKNYVTHFIMNAGLCVADTRCIQRYCNIAVSGTTNTFNDDILIQALNRLPFGGRGAVIYANQTIKSQMDIKAKSQTNINYGAADFGGRSVTTFKGFPVRQLDSILDTEAAVV